ncbi:hypothetical protein AMAG_19702 [Allomyces macrogynus ATCC 38327]|uniref:Uncharacterized protein n=1 Tax=Allomyces macrogynus (strain ATCC 38327) TaxID=578462 RepID=A0A0L0SYV2_ALLM3|nr:hypothetical protein AMAG_19702 [Allomyces macrogynus ATCC 38327]|eukprot:KNE67738.1 hypothetical protein AMAG_19702 [Allomyces macrogynus ATCC 38327]
MKAAVTKHGVFEKMVFSAGYRERFTGKNLAIAQHKIVNAAFRRGWAPALFGGPARHLIEKFDELAASGSVLDPAEWMKLMALDALTVAAFGIDFDSFHHPDTPLVATYNAIVAEIMDVAQLINPLFTCSAAGRRMKELLNQLDRYFFA